MIKPFNQHNDGVHLDKSSSELRTTVGSNINQKKPRLDTHQSLTRILTVKTALCTPPNKNILPEYILGIVFQSSSCKSLFML